MQLNPELQDDQLFSDAILASEKPKRTLTYLGHVFAPERAPRVREVTIDDVPCVHVELSGRHGQRKEMLLYACDYSEIAEPMTAWWGVCVNGKGAPNVASGRRRLGVFTGQSPPSKPRTILSRLITNAPGGTHVHFKNGNPLDLRRSNMEVISLAEHLRRGRAKNRPN